MIEPDKEIRKLLNKAVKQSPYFAAFNRFRYKSPKGYAEYDNAILNLSTHLFKYETPKINEIIKEPTERGQLITDLFRYSLRRTVTNGIRPYWLAKPLATAFLETTPPKDWVLQTEELGGVIFLPSNVFSLADNDPIEWIFFYLDKYFQLIYVSPRKNSDILLARERDIFSTSFTPVTNDGTRKTYNMSTDLELQKERETPGWHDLSPVDKVTDITAQTLLYIENYEPNIKLSHELPTERKTKKNVSSNNINLSCLMVGANYQVKKSNSFSDGNSSSSKSTHWRSGHWRNQPYGDRDNPKTKMIWLEPVLINAQ